MKKQIVTFFLILFKLFAFGQTNKSNLEKENLKGKVKSIHVKCWDKSVGNYSIGAKHEYHMLFNQSGNFIEQNSAWVKFVSTYLYNDKDQLIEYTSVSLDNFSDHVKYKCEYDEKGNLIKRSCYNSDETLKSFKKFLYNEEGKVITTISYLDPTTFEYQNYYFYDDKGNKIKTITEDSDRNKDSTLFIYTYGEKSTVLSLSISSKGIIDSKTTYRYDSSGNKTEEIKYDSSGKKEHTIKYDINGNEIERVYFNEDGSIGVNFNSSFEYDAQHNWTKEIKNSNGNKPWEEYQRVIVYFE